MLTWTRTATILLIVLYTLVGSAQDISHLIPLDQLPTISIPLQTRSNQETHFRKVLAPRISILPRLDTTALSDPKLLEIQERKSPIRYAKPSPSLPARTKDNSLFDIQYYNFKEGMNSNAVTSVLEDSNGYLWMGTYGGGITRYDGFTFTHYTTNEGLAHNVARIIIEDDLGNLWIGTHGGGISIYDGHQFATIDIAGGLPSNRIRSLYKDSQGQIWVGTDDAGLLIYKDQAWVQYSMEEGLSSNGVRTFLESKNGGMWIATVDAGIAYLNNGQMTTIGPQEGLSYPRTRGLHEDEDASLWISTYGAGYDIIKGDSILNYSTDQGLSSNEVWDIIQDENGDYWISTYNGGVCKYDGDNYIILNEDNGLTSNLVWTAYQGRSGHLWFGTENGGLCRYNDRSYRHIVETQGVETSLVYAIDTSQDGHLMFGTLGSGIIISEPSQYAFLNHSNGLPTDRIRDFLHTSDGLLWIATDGAGLVIYDGKDLRSLNTDHGLQNNNIWSLTKDQNENVWISTSTGVDKYDGIAIKNYTTKDGLSSNRQNSSYTDRQGNLWFGTVGGGVNKYDGAQFSHLTKEDGLSGDIVLSIVEDRDGNMWFGTFAGGLNRYDGEEIIIISEDEGLPSNTIWDLITDQSGNIWGATEQGVVQLKWSIENNDYKISTYGEKDGLKSESIHKLYIDSDDNLWIGCAKNLSTIAIADLIEKTDIPKISLDYLELDQQYYDFRATDTVPFTFETVAPGHNYPLGLELPHYMNWLTFHVTSTGAHSSENVSFQYRLNDDSWTSSTHKAQVDFNNLNPGQYTFHVKAREADGPWSEPFQYQFLIEPPWWASKIAYALYLFSILGMVYAIYKFQIGKIQLRNSLAYEKKEALRLIELDKIKSDFFSNISHEFRTPITLIIEPVRQLLKENLPPWQFKNLNLVKKNSETLLLLVNQLLDISKIEGGQMKVDLRRGNIKSEIVTILQAFMPIADEKSISLILKGGEGILDSEFDHDKVRKILSNLLSNALKFTREGVVEITLTTITNSSGDDCFSLKVRDTGQGISAAHLPYIFDRFYQAEDVNYKSGSGTGIGLALSKELTQLLKGSITVESEYGKGTCFEVILPILSSSEDRINDPVLDSQRRGQATQGVKNTNEIASSGLTDQKKILIIEDNDDLRKFIISSLADHWQVLEAPNGDIGCQIAKEYIPDLIVSDLMMPIKGGYEVCEDLKNDKLTAHIPIILLTAKGNIDSKIHGWEVGADAYLTKPFHTEELHIRISKLIEGRLKLQTLFQSGSITQAIKETQELLNPTDQAFLNQVIHHIEEHISETSFSVATLAQLLFMSRTQLFRKIKSILGQSPTEFIKNYKLDRAKELENEHSMMDLAEMLGFKDEKYFRKILKEHKDRSASVT